MARRAKKCVVHPLVLLSVADHYERSGRTAKKRVVGVLLGSVDKNGTAEINNCYAVPFEEDVADTKIWFFDNKFHEKMNEMFLKVKAKEKTVGWYSSGPKLRKSDVAITKMMRKYCDDSVLLVSGVSPEEDGGVSVETYSLADPITESEDNKSFNHLPNVISASDPEEIAVEQMLRDVPNKTPSSLEDNMRGKEASLDAFGESLGKIRGYLSRVQRGELPKNNRVIHLLQEIFNDSLRSQKTEAFVDAYSEFSTESALMLYLSSLARLTLSYCDLADNRRLNRQKARRLAAKAKAKGQEPARAGGDEKEPGKKKDEPAATAGDSQSDGFEDFSEASD